MTEKAKRQSSTIPFGYKLDESGKYLEPIAEELDALNQAKTYSKTCSLREVSQWLHRKTGRYISYEGLRKKFKRDSTSETEENSSQES